MTTPKPDPRRSLAPWRSALTAVALLTALVAFACTGDDEPEPEPTTAPVARSTPRPATATPPPATPTPTPTATEGPRSDMPASPRSTPTPKPAPATPTPTPTPTATPEATPTPPPATATPIPTPVPRTPTPTPEPPRVRPEIEVVGLGRWFNSAPFTIGEQLSRGNVVLIDFWTYSCINCVRTLPYLRDWHDKYAEHGLVILGVHRPEFDFEHSATNVEAAIERLEVTWPVAQDNDSRTWRAFNNRYWPAKYLFDTTGAIVHTRFGEGAYLQFEEEIRAALTRAGSDVSAIPLGQGDQARNAEDRRLQTRELYGGYWRIRGVYAAQDEFYLGNDREVEYEDIADASEREHNKWYVHGLWRNEREAIVHARETTDLGDYFAFLFRARSVNVVLEPPPGQSYDVYITIDGRPLSADEAGSDVVFDAEGNSLIRVDEPRHYAIVELPEFGEHDLRLASNSDQFGVFALTFGSYLEGP